MITAIDNGELDSDLDCAFQSILNCRNLIPVPANLVPIDDPRLDDPRPPLDGSVTDASVAADAGIVQKKLTLDGNVPSAWLGSTPGTAAPGDLAEYKSNKGVPGGYVALDSTGKVPPALLPSDIGTGTVTSVALAMPGEFDVTGSPVTTAGTIVAAWKTQGIGSWFGNSLGVSALPTFSTAPLPPALIPNLDASKITTGVLDPARLPSAVGIGPSHAPGAVPDPGDGSVGLPTDYLARDMVYKPVPSSGAISYQPTVPTPSIAQSPTADISGNYIYTVSSTLPGVSLFYSIGASAPGVPLEIANGGTVAVASGMKLWVYGAKAGYNNSAIINSL
jgi:hypothetical protein